jgi:predicted AlkP superfamily phosphohydrolase/phosphomutase
VSVTPRPPILVISIDGGSFAALDARMAAGDMPALSALVQGGVRGELRSTIPPITPAAWTSFMTGKRPGKHGVYDFRVYDPRSYRDTFVSSRAVRDATLWQLLTAAGLRVCTLNLPMTYPPPADAGTVVSGFDTPSTRVEFTHPPGLRSRILARFPDYGFVATPPADDPNLESDAGFARFVADVEASVRQRTALALELMADGPWDVFLVHVQDIDALQHKVWHELVDATASPARHARLREVYRGLDECIAALGAAMPSGCLTFIVSDHGFGTQAGRVFPNVLLRRWGHLRQRGRGWGRLQRSVRKRLQRLGLVASGPRADWETRVRERAFGESLPVHWSATRAYVGVAEIYGLLYLNLRGREPMGIVTPGAEAEALLADLAARFRAVRDPRDGAAAFEAVLRGDEVDADDDFGRRPDLVLVPRGDLTVSRDLNDRLWHDVYPKPAGTHRPEGILVAAGPGVRAGHVAPVDLIDVAPTLLALAGVAIPDDVDGRALGELFTVAPETSSTPARPDRRADAAALSEQEEADVAQRLRALGYLA